MRTHRAIGAVGVPFGQQRRAAADVSGYLGQENARKRNKHEVTAQSKHIHGGLGLARQNFVYRQLCFRN